MIRRILRAFGFIHKTEICKAALDIYFKHNHFGEKKEDNYYHIGATGAMWEITSRLGIDFYNATRMEIARRTKKEIRRIEKKRRKKS